MAIFRGANEKTKTSKEDYKVSKTKDRGEIRYHEIRFQRSTDHKESEKTAQLLLHSYQIGLESEEKKKTDYG